MCLRQISGCTARFYGGITMAALALILAGAVVLIDQLLKLLVVHTIKVDGAVTVIDHLLRFVYVENKGAAFGLRWLFLFLLLRCSVQKQKASCFLFLPV